MRLFKNQNYKIDLAVVNRTGDFASGLTVTYEVRKSSDNSLIASGTMSEVGSTGIYQTSAISFNNLGKYRIEYTTPITYENMIEEILIIDSTDEIKDRIGEPASGETVVSKIDDVADQVWDENIAGHLGGDKAGQHLEDADAIADPEAVADAVWDELISGHSVDGSFAELFKRIAGLCQENYRIFNPVYVTKNNQACMTSATIKIYPTATDCENNTNAISEYRVSATFDSSARMLNYKVKKV